MMRRILLVGAGNIGRRHLQAMLRIGGNEPLAVDVVEPSEDGRAETRRVLEAAASDSTRSARAPFVTVHTELPEVIAKFDLAVIATGAGPRRAIFEAIEAHGGARAYIFEKVLFVRTRDLVEVGNELSAHSIPAWVNCARRLFPAYHALRDRLAGRPGVTMCVTGSRYNLASNAIHFLDLLSFLTGDELVSVATDGLEPGSHPSRHAGRVEIFGTLGASYENGGKAELHCRPDGDEPTRIEIIDGAVKYVIEEGQGKMTCTQGRDMTTEPFHIPYVSESFWPYADILSTSNCMLTSYSQSARQHLVFIDALRRHLGISLLEDAACPIT